MTAPKDQMFSLGLPNLLQSTLKEDVRTKCHGNLSNYNEPQPHGGARKNSQAVTIDNRIHPLGIMKMAAQIWAKPSILYRRNKMLCFNIAIEIVMML